MRRVALDWCAEARSGGDGEVVRRAVDAHDATIVPQPDFMAQIPLASVSHLCRPGHLPPANRVPKPRLFPEGQPLG